MHMSYTHFIEDTHFIEEGKRYLRIEESHQDSTAEYKISERNLEKTTEEHTAKIKRRSSERKSQRLGYYFESLDLSSV